MVRDEKRGKKEKKKETFRKMSHKNEGAKINKFN